MRTPNSKECLNNGLGMYNIPTNIGAEASWQYNNLETMIGCFDCDELNDDGTHSEGRIEISVDIYGRILWLDLEDILVFAKKYCPAMYWRIDANTESVSN